MRASSLTNTNRKGITTVPAPLCHWRFLSSTPGINLDPAVNLHPRLRDRRRWKHYHPRGGFRLFEHPQWKRLPLLRSGLDHALSRHARGAGLERFGAMDGHPHAHHAAIEAMIAFIPRPEGCVDPGRGRLMLPIYLSLWVIDTMLTLTPASSARRGLKLSRSDWRRWSPGCDNQMQSCHAHLLSGYHSPTEALRPLPPRVVCFPPSTAFPIASHAGNRRHALNHWKD